MTFTDLETYVTVTCCYANCGITFGLPNRYHTKRREDHAWWYCPNGHTQHFAGKSEAEKLRAELAAEKSNTEYYRREQYATQRSLCAMKGVLMRTKNRIAAGVCPCCNRTFINLGRHMKHLHPNYREEEKP